MTTMTPSDIKKWPVVWVYYPRYIACAPASGRIQVTVAPDGRAFRARRIRAAMRALPKRQAVISIRLESDLVLSWESPLRRGQLRLRDFCGPEELARGVRYEAERCA